MSEQTRRVKAGRERRGSWLWSRLHFLVRLTGLTGLVALGVGLVLLRGVPDFYANWRVPLDTVQSALRGKPFDTLITTGGVYAVLAGSVALLVAVLMELLVMLFFVAGRRSAMGLNAVVQIALAGVLVIGVNVAAFFYPYRKDCTRAQEFTLPAAVEADLKQLKEKTTIVVHLRQKSTKADPEDEEIEAAANRMVVESIKDLVEQFRQVGPQFQVVVLNAGEKGYRTKLEEATKDAPELREAIKETQDNSIFFYANKRVQQLSFNEFYQIDKMASKEGRGNLVLLAQGVGASGRGVETFARKIVNVDERRPRVGVLVVHDLLTTKGAAKEYHLQGLRKSLEARGFEVRDIVLWKGLETPNPEAVAYTLGENRLGLLENRLLILDVRLRHFEQVERDIPRLLKELNAPPVPNPELERRRLLQLSREYIRVLGGFALTPDTKEEWIEYLDRLSKFIPEEMAEHKQERESAQKEIEQLHLAGADVGRRMTDLTGKLSRVLAECDMLFISRPTRLSPDRSIPYRIHRLNEQHLSAIRDFMKSGKPVLACLGPANDPPQVPSDPEDANDGLDQLFAELGVRLGQQTVLYSVDSKAIAESRQDSFLSSSSEKVPPIDFEGVERTLTGYRSSLEMPGVEEPNPLRQSLRVTSRSAGPSFDLALRFARPVYYDPTTRWQSTATEAAGNFGLLAAPGGAGPLLAYTGVPRKVRRTTASTSGQESSLTSAQQVAATVGRSSMGDWSALGVVRDLPRKRIDPTFLYSAPGWNEPTPYLQDDIPPRFYPPRPNDPANGTLDERRRGTFPVGVALDAPIPASWGVESPTTVRVVVIGQGDLFIGSDLPPMKEQLALQTTNWLLSREDHLPRAEYVWRYPRVEYSPVQQELWVWGAWAGLPVGFFYLGVVVLLARRLR